MSAKIDKKTIPTQVYQSVFFSLVLDPRPGGEELPVAVRVAYEGKKTFFRTGLKLTSENFEKILRSTKGSNLEIKNEQMAFFNKVVRIAKDLVNDDAFSFQNLKQKLRSRCEYSLNSVFEENIARLREAGKFSTASNYEAAYKKMLEMLKVKVVELSDLSPELIATLKKRMEDDGMSGTTVGIYLRSIRIHCNIALSRGLIKISQYPFKRTPQDTNKVSIPKGSKRKDCFLRVEEILKMMTYDTPERRNDSVIGLRVEAMHLWVFSYLANGLNLADMAQLTYNNHYFRSHEREFMFIRQKTADTTSEEIPIYIPIIPELQRILDLYAAPPKKGGKVFPFILAGVTDVERTISIVKQWNKNIKTRLRKVCAELGMDVSVSMTWARHSFQTNLAHKKVPESYIDQAVGHTDVSITDGYIGMYSTEDRFRYNSLLLEPDKEA